MKKEKEKSVERRVADTILEKPNIITVRGKEYEVKRPTTSMLIEISAIIAQERPEVDSKAENIFSEVLRTAKNFTFLGDVLAVLIQGDSKNSFIKNIRNKRLARTIIDTVPGAELKEMFTELLFSRDISDFFALTVFLSEVNILKPIGPVRMKKTVSTKTTASGPSSEV